MQTRTDIGAALRSGILVPNPDYRDDQRTVLNFSRLAGRPSRPIDSSVVVRDAESFTRLRRRLPDDFFVPFDELLALVNWPSLRVEANPGAISIWNDVDYVTNLVKAVSHNLDEGASPNLVPVLVWVFNNLERERPVPDADWDALDAISIPGSRTFDRAAEGFRAFILSKGRAFFMLSGRAPYYDPTNEDYELTEAEANAAYLRLLGVPARKILNETMSQDTSENADFLPAALRHVQKTTGQDHLRLLLATSPFHLARYGLSVAVTLERVGLTGIELFAVGSRASRYWAETYFLADPKTAYAREAMMGIVFNEYVKIAYDICADRPTEKSAKEHARRE
jgi:hypothetical protein